MAIQTSNIANSNTSSTTHPDATSASASAKPAPTATEAMARNKAQVNTQIVQASLTVSISAGNESQQLVLRNVVDKLNELLDDGSGIPALQTASQQDNSPEGTAGRIVSLATGFYEAFAKKHPNADESETAAAFMETIRSGIEQGFKDARGILEGLSALQGDVASNVDKTYELVMKGLDEFMAKFQPKESTEAGAQAGTPTEAKAGVQSDSTKPAA
ncbi:hypothetical protein FXN63_09400 [Pigmentiphaga aceris]|uniref:DUF5610 domain-containing protein n=1 Tax=Pigmentiphaga aceris TaxID=1940612 RepID=A0A5C0B078_9BURK|nr:DUF5610 domain-containing protein [Pigmentiphaga aceris]QEI06027.1 hypothetical protein FXN63_09400 [Pigmentiphaga aceris]